MAKLMVRQGRSVGAEFAIPPGKDRVTLGRRRGTDLPIADPKASRDHAEIIIEGNLIKVRDLKSRNGTLLNGRKIELDERLEYGDRIRIGDVILELVDDGDVQAPPHIPGYEILDLMGRGRMGAVYKAKQLSMDRVVALKVLNEKYSKNEAFVSRFLKEAQGAAQLSHPNIIHVHDANYTGKTYYISMEYVDGRTVEALLKKAGRIDVTDALAIAVQAARALGFAHGKNIIHRDVRPGTIMVTRDIEVKLADVGLVKSFDERVGDSRRPKLSGSPHYMSPEQALGKAADARTDIYSLGATLYHMLTGTVPFQADSIEKVLEAHTTSYLPAIQETEPDVPDSLATIVERMMAREPDKRYQSMAAVTADLEKVKTSATATVEKVKPGESSVTGAAPAVVEKKRRYAARKRIIRKSADVGGMVAAVAIAVIAVVVAFWYFDTRPARLAAPAHPQESKAPSVSHTERTESSAVYEEPKVGWGDIGEPTRPPAEGADVRGPAGVDAALDLSVGTPEGAAPPPVDPDAGGPAAPAEQPTEVVPPPAGPEQAAEAPAAPGVVPEGDEPPAVPEVAPEVTEAPAAPGAPDAPAPQAPEPPAVPPAAGGPAAAEPQKGNRVTRLLGYCRPEAWERGALALADGTKLHGVFLNAGNTVRFKTGKDAAERTVSADQITEVEFTRPNNIDVSMGDFILKQGKREEALKRYERALKAEPGHPYVRMRIDECSPGGAESKGPTTSVPEGKVGPFRV